MADITTILTPAKLLEWDKKQSKVAMPIWDTFFKRVQFSKTGLVAVAKEHLPIDQILPFVSRGGAVPSRDGLKPKIFQYLNISEYGEEVKFTAEEIFNYQDQLKGLDGNQKISAMSAIYQDVHRETLEKVRVTREWMAGQAILGKIVDKDGEILMEFDIPAENKLPSVPITPTTDFSVILEEMIQASKKATNHNGSYALIAGAKAYLRIIQTEDYKTWSRNANNNLSVEDSLSKGVGGYVGNGIKVIQQSDFYDKGSTKSRFFDEDMIVLAPTDVFSRVYAPLASGVGGNMSMKSVTELVEWLKATENPVGQSLKVLSSLMPVPTLPNAIVSRPTTDS